MRWMSEIHIIKNEENKLVNHSNTPERVIRNKTAPMDKKVVRIFFNIFVDLNNFLNLDLDFKNSL